MVRHSFGKGGFDASEEYDTEAPPGRFPERLFVVPRAEVPSRANRTWEADPGVNKRPPDPAYLSPASDRRAALPPSHPIRPRPRQVVCGRCLPPEEEDDAEDHPETAPVPSPAPDSAATPAPAIAYGPASATASATASGSASGSASATAFATAPDTTSATVPTRPGEDATPK